MKRWRVVAGAAVVVAAMIILAVMAAPWASRRSVTGYASMAREVAPSEAADLSAQASPSLARRASPGAGTAAGLMLPTASELALEQAAADTLRLLIRTGQVVIQVDSLERGVAEVRRIAVGAGAYVASSSQTTTERVRSATIEIKVPAQRFDRVIDGLRAVGRVEVANVAAEDVGEEYVDVAARMANSRRLEGRLLDLLTTRAGRLQDVLEVERELARVREEIERYAGRLQYLRQHAAVSTITVELHEPGTVVGERPGLGAIGEALLQAWRNLVWVVAFLIQALGVVVPLALLAWGGWAVWQRYGRKAA